jgi:signal transduction histidine kinase
MKRRSLAVELGAWHALLLTAAFALVGAASFVVLRHSLMSAALTGVERRADQVATILREAPADVAPPILAHEIETRLAPEINSRYVRITRLPDTLIYQSGPPANGSFDPARIARAPGGDAGAGASELVQPQNLLLYRTQVSAPSGDYRLETGVSIQATAEALAQLRNLLLVLLPVLLACATAGGYLLVSRALRDVDRIAQTAAQISVQNHMLRLPVVRSGDALERLSKSLNMMLSRLSESVMQSRRFVADASHELRTPLTVIKLELNELAAMSHLDSGELHDRVGSVLEEVARLEQLVAGLLVISRLDAGENNGIWIDVDLAEVAASVAEQMRLLAEENGVEIDLAGLAPATVNGDPARLKQIIVNLLDNALRYTPRGGRVTLRTATDPLGSILEVSDTGIGIPPAALPHVFDRFFRVDTARGREQGGGGLGLSIVRSICLLYGATIDVRSTPGEGTSFVMHFPRLDGDAATSIESLQPPATAA